MSHSHADCLKATVNKVSALLLLLLLPRRAAGVLSGQTAGEARHFTCNRRWGGGGAQTATSAEALEDANATTHTYTLTHSGF